MVATGANQSLADVLHAGAEFTPEAALQLVDRVAAAVEQCHAAGRVHGGILPERIHIDASTDACPPPGESVLPLRRDADAAIWLPPVLRTSGKLEIPAAIELARQALQAAGVTLDPSQIDLHALGELLCRLLSGESVDAYSRSARLKGRIPAHFWPVLERAVAMNGQAGFADAAEFRQALAAATQASLPPRSAHEATDADAASTPERSGLQSDTKPSFVSTQDEPADTSVGGAPAVAAGVEAGRQPKAARGAEAAIPFERLGHYEITGRIGHGGMGDVYLGFERALDRKVAIKVLPATLAEHPEFVRRFRAEATAAARLIHPNIIQIHFIGEDAGHHYFAMQYVEGESLADLLTRSTKLAVADGLAIVEQALAGLSAAHRQGLVHRDIKPGNILLDRHNQRALLADFGLVKSLGMSETGHTATSVIMGTVDYMSPEQGRGLAVDGRSDLYSIGVLCYRMFSGRLPFDGDNPTSLIFQHAYEQAPSLASIAPSVPAHVRDIVEKLMAKAPADRYQSADEVLADLRAFRAGLPLPSRARENAKPAAPTRAAESRPRATTIIHVPLADEAPPLPDGLLSTTPPKWWERTRDRALSLFRRHAPEVLAKLENTQQQVDGAVAEYRRRQQRFQQLASEAEQVLATLQAELRDHPTPELQRQLSEQEEQLGLIRVKLAQVNAVLQQLVGQRDLLNARLQVARTRGGVRPQRLTPLRVAILLAKFAAVVAVCVCVALLLIDDRPVVAPPAPLPNPPTQEERLRQAAIKEQDSKKPIPLMQFLGSQQRVNRVAFSQTGNVLFTGGDDRKVRLWNPDNGSVIRVLEDLVPQHSQPIYRMAVSPDGSRLATGSGLKLWDVQSGTILHRPEVDLGFSTGMVFSPDGQKLVISRAASKIQIIDFAEGKFEGTISTAPLSPSVLAGSSQGDLAVGTNVGKVGLTHISSDRPLRILDDVDSAISALAYSRDGALLAAGTARGVVLVWNAATGKVLDKLQREDAAIQAVAFVHEGRSLAVATADQVELWDRELHRPRKTIEIGGIRDIAVSADDRKLVTVGDRPFQVSWDLSPEPDLVTKPHTEIKHPATDRLNAASRAKRIVAFGVNSVGYWDYAGNGGFQVVAKDLGPQNSLAISADGRLAAGGGQDGTVRIWELSKNRELRRINVSASLTSNLKQGSNSNLIGTLQVNRVQFDSDGKNLLVVTDRTCFLWDLVTGRENDQFVEGVKGGHGGALSSNGKLLATASYGIFRLWDMSTGKYARSITFDRAESLLSFSRDGRQLFSFSDGAVRLWDVQTGSEIRTWKIDLSDFSAGGVALSPDGKWIAVGEHQVVRVFDANRGDEVLRFTPGSRSVAFTQDGRYLAANGPFGGEAMIRLWDLQSLGNRAE